MAPAYRRAQPYEDCSVAHLEEKNVKAQAQSDITPDRATIAAERDRLVQEGRYAEASALELAFLSANPNDAAFHQKASWTFKAMGNFWAALRHQKRAVEIKPSNSAARMVLARLLDASGKHSAASAERDRANKYSTEAQKLFEIEQIRSKVRSQEMVRRNLQTLLPRWRHATSTEAQPSFQNLFDKHNLDDVQEWMVHSPKLIPAGNIVDFGEIGRFRVGDPKQVIHKRLARNMPWELPIAALLVELASRCDSASLILDVGANIGTLTIPIARAFNGKVLAFEPIDRNYRCLVEHINLNGLTNVMARQQACSRSAGFGKMIGFADDFPGRAQLSTSEEGSTEVTTIDIAVAGAPVALIKMDVEGHESDVLAGAEKTVAKDRPLILCELLSRHRHVVKARLAQYCYVGLPVFRSDWIFYPSE
jgi:FkbM family methyltransferase